MRAPYKYRVRLPDTDNAELFTDLKSALKYARACKADHGGASVIRLMRGGLEGSTLYRWTKGQDGKVRRVNVIV